MAEHHELRPKCRTTVETSGPCGCQGCVLGRPWVAVQELTGNDAAALMVMGLGGSTAVRLDATELRKLAALCMAAVWELEKSQAREPCLRRN